MSKEIRFNAFAMNCVGHMAPGLWRHPRDRSDRYIDLTYWTELAQLLERGKFDGLFLADVLGPYDVYKGRADAISGQRCPELWPRSTDAAREVCYKLWERSWDRDAVRRDRKSGIFADPAKVHGIEHSGKYFRVPGFSLSEPSPQRTPVLY
jgi:alkanesulfonate monooxygenase SsuD/methylene tetrahydromethanopterin reductase-like flavin-dependent oxidoreductase (luciferase family)